MRIELIAFVTGAALACVIAPSVAQNNVVPVTIDNFVFSPERVTVKVGTTVTWTNHDDIPHTVAAKDRGFKFQQYKMIASLEEYVLVSQSEPLIERFGRNAGGLWTGYSDARGLSANLKFESLSIEISLGEIYRDISFDNE